MKLLSFLKNREIGTIYNGQFNEYDKKPDFDDLLFRLACKDDDVYSSTSENGYVPPFACKFRRDKTKDLLAFANEDGFIQLIDTERKDYFESFVAHNNAIFDICWLPDKCHLVTASGDSKAHLFDMNTFKMISCFSKHTESIKTIDVCPSASYLFATGSRDGDICVWDTRVRSSGENMQHKPSILISSAHDRVYPQINKMRQIAVKERTTSSISAVAFQNDVHLVSTGAADGVLKVWDLRKTYICKGSHKREPRYQIKYTMDKSGHGCTSLVFDSTYKKLYGCSTANKILLFDCHSFSDPVVSYEGLKCNTYFVKVALSADDQYLVSGSSDQKAYVWKTNRPGLPIMELPGHASEVTAVTWGSYDVPKIVTCGDDNKVFLWKIVNQECPEDMKFSFAVPKAYVNRKEPPTSPYSTCSGCSPTNDTITPTKYPKVPTVKSIKSFFQPGSSGASALNSVSPSLVSGSSLLKDNSDSQQNDTENKTHLLDQKILSPSKVVNMNETVFPESLDIPMIHFNFRDKENHPERSSKITLTTVGASSAQVKRKLLSSDSTPKSEKLHSVKKGKRNHLSANKKKNERNSGSILDYFNKSLSPEE